MYLDKFIKAAKEIQHRHRSGENLDPKPMTIQHDESNWLISYADMMTLLCGFFIMMFMLASLNVPKYRKVTEEISKHFNGETTPHPPPELSVIRPFETLEVYLTRAVQELGIDQSAIVSTDLTGVNIIFESTVFFDSLNAELNPKGAEILEKLVTVLKERQSQEARAFKIVVEGHTDSKPVHSNLYPSNWELSGARAARVVRLFVERDFLPDQLMAVGFGDTRPVTPAGRMPSGEWDEQALSKNRRVVLRLLGPQTDSIPWYSEPAKHAD